MRVMHCFSAHSWFKQRELGNMCLHNINDNGNKEGADHVWLPLVFFITAGPSSRAVQGVGLRPLACWGCGFESRRGIGCLFWVLSGRGLFVGLITCPEESYRVCCSVTVEPRQWEGPGPLGGVAPWGKKALLQLNVITPKRGGSCYRM
jgi:hypothetical protein